MWNLFFPQIRPCLSQSMKDCSSSPTFPYGGPDWDQSYFFPFLAPLAQSCRLIAFDLRGCGRSQKFYDPERYHLDLAVRLLDRFPARVSKLILASSTAYEHVADELEHWEEYQLRHNEAMREAELAIWHASCPAAEQRTGPLADLTLPLDIYHLDLLPLARQVIERIDFSGEWMQAWQAGRLRGIQHADYAARLRELSIPLLILPAWREGYEVSRRGGPTPCGAGARGKPVISLTLRPPKRGTPPSATIPSDRESSAFSKRA